MFPAVQLSIVKNKFLSDGGLSFHPLFGKYDETLLHEEVIKKDVEKRYKDLLSRLLMITYWYFSGVRDFCSVFQGFAMCNLSEFLSPYKLLLSHLILYSFPRAPPPSSVSTSGLSKPGSVPASTLMFSNELDYWRDPTSSVTFQMIKQKTRKVDPFASGHTAR